MAYDVPNESQAAHGEQATLFSTDVDALIQGLNREGVISGCAVTAQTPPAMAVDVAIGVGRIGGSDVNVAAGSVNITAADATRMRIDIIVVNNAGAKSAVDGTWDATDNPLMPTISANSILLAGVFVPATATTITVDEIIDKRVFLGAIQEGDIPAAIMRDAEHTAIGDGAPHHTKYTDAEVEALIAVHAAIAAAHHAVFTTTEHTAIGDGTPHHAPESGESGTHIHDARYYTEAETDAAIDADIATHAGAADPHTGYQKESEKDTASGYAGLTAGTKLNLTQMQEVIGYADLTDDLAILKTLLTTRGDMIFRNATVPARLAKGTAGKFVKAGADDPEWAWDEAGIEFIIDGGGAVISTGVAGGLEVPFDCFVTGWTITAIDGNTGAIAVDVWKDTYANFPPTVADTIAGTEKPTITATGNKGQDLTLATWTQALTKGDWLFFNVDSVATLERVCVSLRVEKYRTT